MFPVKEVTNCDICRIKKKKVFFFSVALFVLKKKQKKNIKQKIYMYFRKFDSQYLLRRAGHRKQIYL